MTQDTSPVEPQDDAKAVVYVVDDDAAVRDSLGYLLESVGLAVVTCAAAGAFMDRYDPNRPGCLVTDVRMPGMSGIDLQAHLRRVAPDLPVIIVTGHGDVPMAVRAMKAGAYDFIEKPYNDQALLDVVQTAVADSRRAAGARAETAEVLSRLSTLTPREREVLDLVADGLSNKGVARHLGISGKTVETHRARVMEKMQAGSLAELLRLLYACGVTGKP